MELILKINFFGSVLGASSTPSFSSDAPYQIGLLFEGSSELVGVEFLHTLEALPSDESILIVSKTINIAADATHLVEGAEFFVSDGGKMIARGKVDGIGR